MMWKDYYEILQVSPNAEPSVITAAYRRLAQTYHPDVAGNPAYSARMAVINEAYGILSDPARRAAYDREYKLRYGQQMSELEMSNEEVIIGLINFAAARAAEGKKRRQVADELAGQGVPYNVAAEVVDRVFAYRSKLQGKEGGKLMGCGVLMLVIGGIITGISYSAASAGEHFIVTTGLLLVGGITFISGLYKWITS